MENWIFRELKSHELGEVRTLSFGVCTLAISVSPGLSTGRLRAKGLVKDAALGRAVTGNFAGLVPSWFEAMFLGYEEVSVFWIVVKREGNGWVDFVRSSRVAPDS